MDPSTVMPRPREVGGRAYRRVGTHRLSRVQLFGLSKISPSQRKAMTTARQIQVNVTLTGSPGEPYTWQFSTPNNNPPIDPNNGNITVHGPGPTVITYTLSTQSTPSVQLLYPNMSLNDDEGSSVRITSQISAVNITQRDSSGQ